MALKGIIAEIGNHHFGSVQKAQQLIRAAKEAGADFVKMQVIDPLTASKVGSMPYAFYEQCAMRDDEYEECRFYAFELNIPLFFSVFVHRESDLNMLALAGDYYKISGTQFINFSNDQLKAFDKSTTIVSIPKTTDDILRYKSPWIQNMNLMYVGPYNESPSWPTLVKYQNYFRRPIGLSDHSVGISNCLTAIADYNCELIEKHFNIYGEQKFRGYVYRDSIHAADAKSLETLCKFHKDKTK